MFILIGLGNPGEEYKDTRHNTGRMALQYFAKKEKLGEFEEDKNLQALVLSSKFKKEKILMILPETFMNNSGKTVRALINEKILKKTKNKEIKNFILLHDDLDIPLGKFKFSYAKNSAGHKGVESIIRALKTKNFARIRIGISPKKKPEGKKVIDFILGKFAPKEKKLLTSVFKKIFSVLQL